MTGRISPHPKRFLRSEEGAALVEFAVVLPIFLLLLFTLIEFGRMGGDFVMADKAMQRAVRIAAVRPAACAGVPSVNARGNVPANSAPPKYGTSCLIGTTCAAPATVTCTGSTTGTAAEVWGAVRGLLPGGTGQGAATGPGNLRFSYAYDPALNFLGGPYVPSVSVELTGMSFRFVLPLDGLARVAGASSGGPAGTVAFPAMRMTLPGEDLAQGNDG